MSQRIIDLLEVIEVEAHHRTFFISLSTQERLFHLFPEENAIWQVGERIMTGHMRNAHLRPSSLRNILMRGDPPASPHWSTLDPNGASIAQFSSVVCREATLMAGTMLR